MDTKQTPLSPELLRHMHTYWRTANDLSVGQISLYDNPLLKEALQLEHVKPKLLGHWGTTPGCPRPTRWATVSFTAAPTTRPTNGLMRALETICGGWPPTPRCMYWLPSRAWTDYPGTRKHGRASARP